MVQSFFTLDLGKCVFLLLDSVNPSWKEKKNIVNVEISFLMAAAVVVVFFFYLDKCLKMLPQSFYIS